MKNSIDIDINFDWFNNQLKLISILKLYDYNNETSCMLRIFSKCFSLRIFYNTKWAWLKNNSL